jgi:hypothetical protein
MRACELGTGSSRLLWGFRLRMIVKAVVVVLCVETRKAAGSTTCGNSSA